MGIIQAAVRRRFVETDPHYASVFLICGFETNFNDDKGRVGTASSLAERSTTYSKAGTHSVTFLQGVGLGAKNRSVTYVDSADFNCSAAFTFEFSIRMPATQSGVYSTILTHPGGADEWGIYAEDLGGGNFRFAYYSGVAYKCFSGSFPFSADYDVALSRSGGVVRFHVNGVAQAADFDSVSLGGTGTLQVGSAAGFEAAAGAFIDEVRLTKDVARYTSANYTPRTTAFPRA